MDWFLAGTAMIAVTVIAVVIFFIAIGAVRL